MKTTNTIANNATFTLTIDDMSCGHCVQAVKGVLSALPSVKVRSVAVGSAEIEALNIDAANDAVAALEKAGYPARVMPHTASANKPSSGGCCGGPSGCCG